MDEGFILKEQFYLKPLIKNTSNLGPDLDTLAHAEQYLSPQRVLLKSVGVRWYQVLSAERECDCFYY